MKLAKIMSELKITQIILAKKLNVSQSLISQWINRKCEPQLDMISKLSKELNCTTDEILNCFKKWGVFMTREDLLRDRQFLNKDDIMQMFGCSDTVAYKKIREIRRISDIAGMPGKILIRDYENWLNRLEDKLCKN